jgi:hypothetical protein
MDDLSKNGYLSASEAAVLTLEALNRTRMILHESEELLHRVKDISRPADLSLLLEGGDRVGKSGHTRSAAMSENKRVHSESDTHPAKPKPSDDIVEESTEGDGGPTGSGGVASQSPTPGDEPGKHHKHR